MFRGGSRGGLVSFMISLIVKRSEISVCSPLLKILDPVLMFTVLLLNPHAHMSVSPCYADEVFSKSALQRLKAAGFNPDVLLADFCLAFIDAIGITADVRDEISAEKSVANAFDYWLSNQDDLCRPPTWRSLLDVLCELGLGGLSQQIDDFLSDGMS